MQSNKVEENNKSATTSVEQQNRSDSSESTISTKDRIEQTALELFAMRGYSAVSIRDIGKVVGIKESSIYYHFENKQAIMNSMLDKVNHLIRQMEATFEQSFDKAEEISEVAMVAVAKGFLINYFLNPYVYQIIRMLSIERNQDAKAESVYQRLMFELPLRQQREIFEKMMQRGFIGKASPDVLAEEYLAIIYTAFMKNCVGYGMDDSRIEKAKAEVAEGISDIYRKMR